MADIFISNRDQLVAALANASGGETFVLAAGDYGRLNLNGRQYDSTVTIRSADPSTMAKFNSLNIYNTANLAFKSVDIGRPLAAGEGEWTQMGYITGSRNIGFDGVRIHGSLDGNPGNDGWGLLVDSTQGLSIANSDFTELARAFVIERSSDIRIANNAIHHIRSDGGDFAAVDRVTIENNRYWAFAPNGTDHPDAIQFWTNGQARGSSNVIIRGNQIFQGAGTGTQGIFIRDENGSMPHRNVVIENNIIYSRDQWEGISVDGAVGLRILNNTVVSPTGDAKTLWIRVDSAQDVTIARNVADNLLLGAVSNLQQSDNVIFKTDPGKLGLMPNINAGAAAAVADLVMPNYGYQPGESVPVPSPVPTPVPVPTPPIIKVPPPAPLPAPAPTTIYGTAASETISGKAGADTIFGVGRWDANPGRGSIDKLIGGAGNDLFVLGDQRGAFYNDGSVWSSGRGDYGQILDFQPGADKVQLAGSFDQYLFRGETLNGRGGVSILLDTNGNDRIDSRDELIGHIAGIGKISPDFFVFG